MSDFHLSFTLSPLREKTIKHGCKLTSCITLNYLNSLVTWPVICYALHILGSLTHLCLLHYSSRARWKVQVPQCYQGGISTLHHLTYVCKGCCYCNHGFIPWTLCTYYSEFYLTVYVFEWALFNVQENVIFVNVFDVLTIIMMVLDFS